VIRAITPAGLTDEELRQADEAIRRWYGRALALVNDTGCTLEMAIAAVRAADEEAKSNGILKQRAAAT
jgi:hypothetical protein